MYLMQSEKYLKLTASVLIFTRATLASAGRPISYRTVYVRPSVCPSVTS